MARVANFVDYQAKAAEFSVGDVVIPFGMFEAMAGRVTAVWPAIGMIDVEMATGNKRYPVEDLQRIQDGSSNPTHTNTAPGGPGTVSVPGGPAAKQALYWASRDRKYRMTKTECEGGRPCCPRCSDRPPLSRATYKRRSGASERLFGCKGCLFLIKESDIVNLPGALPPEDESLTMEVA